MAAEQLSLLIGDALGHVLTAEETAYLAACEPAVPTCTNCPAQITSADVESHRSVGILLSEASARSRECPGNAQLWTTISTRWNSLTSV